MSNYRKIWEMHNNASLLKSTEIHHIDGNHNNNNPENLLAVSIEEHYEIHAKQKDYGACQAILLRMKDPNRQKISELAQKSQRSLWESGNHNFQKMSKERKIEISRNAANKTVKEKKGIHAINSDPILAAKNAKNAGLAAKEKRAGFLNTDSQKHGGKFVKNTFWWRNSITKEKRRSKECPGDNWIRGMK